MSAAVPCVCPACRRRFVVVVGEHSTRASAPGGRCVCGAALVAVELQDGVFEIRRSRRATRRKPLRHPKRAAAEPAASPPLEPDQGYGESHGYGPAHGGPTGPGDAPAPEAPAPTDEPG